MFAWVFRYRPDIFYYFFLEQPIRRTRLVANQKVERSRQRVDP